MEDNNKKKLINETVTGRRLTPRRALRYVFIAGICGAAFGCGIFLTQSLTAHVNASSDKQHQEQTESPTAGNDVGDNNGISETETSVSESEPGNSISDNGKPKAEVRLKTAPILRQQYPRKILTKSFCR